MPLPRQNRDMQHRYGYQQQQQLAAEIHETLGMLSYKYTMEAVLEYILQRAQELLQADAAVIYRLRKKEGFLYIQAAQGIATSYAASMRVSLGKGAIGRAVLEGRTVTISKDAPIFSAEECPELQTQQRRLLERMFSRFNTLLAIPLIAGDEIYGGIVLYYTYLHEFTEDIHTLAGDFGKQAALAIENVRLFNEAKNKVAQEERLRLARNLHDSVIQAIYGITLYTEASLRLLSTGDSATASFYMCEIQETAMEALQEMRLLIFELRPPILEREGIVCALRARLDAVENRTRMVTSLQVEGEITLTDQIEEALYRIAQEALNNILKHAHAHTVTMKLSQDEQHVQLDIADDGTGFDLNAVQNQGGAGLRGIAERVAHIGATLAITSAPGKGTRIQVVVEV